MSRAFLVLLVTVLCFMGVGCQHYLVETEEEAPLIMVKLKIKVGAIEAEYEGPGPEPFLEEKLSELVAKLSDLAQGLPLQPDDVPSDAELDIVPQE